MSALVGVQNRKPRIFRELNAVVTIAARDIVLALKSPAVIIMSFAMPLVMMGMLGGSLRQNMAGGLGFDYGQYMIIGMIVNMLFMLTIMNMTTLVEDRETDFTQEMMISPVSRYAIVCGKILGSSFSAVLALFCTLVVGFFMGITIGPGQMLILLGISPLLCLSAGALSMIIMGVIQSNRGAHIAVMMVMMPQMFLSGAIIPITNAGGVLWVLSRLMPMTYCLDLARAVVYAGTPEYGQVVLFNPALNFLAITVLTLVCLVAGTFLFARSEKRR